MISVIICHHKGDLIHKALESFRKTLEVEYEIIVATSIEGIEFLGTKTICVQGGPAHKRNVAAKFAQGDLLAFFDDDVEVLPYTLSNLQNTLLVKRAGAVFGKLLNMEFKDRFDEAGSFLTPTGFLWARAESGVKDQGQFDDECEVFAGKSAAVLMRRKIFWEVGGFDASYEILGEETDLAWRIWLAGYVVYYCPKSVTFHAFNTKFKPADFYTPKRVYFNGCRNYLSMLLTNLGNPGYAAPVFFQFIVWFTAGLGMLLTGKYEAGLNIFKGLFWVIKNLPVILLKRHKVQSTRKISDKDLLPRIMRTPPWSYYFNRFFHYIKTGRHG